MHEKKASKQRIIYYLYAEEQEKRARIEKKRPRCIQHYHQLLSVIQSSSRNVGNVSGNDTVNVTYGFAIISTALQIFTDIFKCFFFPVLFSHILLLEEQ